MDKNTIIAIVLCMLVLIIYTRFIIPRYQPKPGTAAKKPVPEAEKGKEKPPAAEAAAEKKPSEPPAAKPKEIKAKPEKAGPPAPKVPEPPVQNDIVVDFPESKIRTVWTNRGGGLREAYLKEYYVTVAKKNILPLLGEVVPGRYSLVISDPDEKQPFDSRVYDVVRHERELIFKSGFGQLEVVKTVKFPEGKYHVELEVSFRNNGGSPLRNQRYCIASAAGIIGEGGKAAERYIETVVGIRDDRGVLDRNAAPIRKLRRGERVYEGDVQWGGTVNKYFGAMLLPMGLSEDWLFSARAYVLEPEKKSGTDAFVFLTTKLFGLDPGESVTHRYLFYMGPKDKDILADKEYHDLAMIVSYGWFGSISGVLLAILDFFYRIVHNYGAAIIMLTLLVKLMLHPLTRKMQVSMHKMQKLQPLIAELKEKYKNDSRRLGQEQWALFRQHKVNPLGGCLPMFIQFPVFIALFRALQLSIDLRHAPFFGWIKDLSKPDTLPFKLPFPLPFLGKDINPLPIAMTITWVVQQLTMPKAVDEQQRQQQKMMLFMPIVFGIMLYKMPSGLALYWFVSTLVSIFEQYYIKRMLANMPDIVPAPSGEKKQKRKRR